MKFIYRISLAAVFSAATFYCSGKTNIQIATAGSEIKAAAEANNVQAQVLADIGATLSIEKSVQLTIPAGALDQDTLISIDKKSVAAAQGILVPVAKSLELGAHGTQFSKSVALNVCYDPQTLAKQNLYEDTLAVYYVDPQTGEYGSVGGAVNKTTHCVSANIEHFSTYLVAAQNLSLNLTPAEQLPQISVTYVPGTPIAGLPVKVRAAITDFKLTPVSNGSGVQVGFGQIATVRYCYYAAPAVTCSGGLQNLAPDYDDEANNFYSFTIPGNQVNAQGFTVLYEVYNSLGFKRTRTVNYVPTRTATGIQFTSNAVVNLAAGFKRSYTIQGLSDVGAPQNIPIDSFILNGGIGTAVKTSASVIRVTGTTANPQAMRTGSLTVTAGAFNITSPDINVHAGLLDHIALLSPTGVVLGNSINVNANATYDFDVLGYDAFGNTSNVLPQFILVPLTGAGTITSTGLYTAPATVQSATLVATLNGVMVSLQINVGAPAASIIPLQTFNGAIRNSRVFEAGPNLYSIDLEGSLSSNMPLSAFFSIWNGTSWQSAAPVYTANPGNTAEFLTHGAAMVGTTPYVSYTVNDGSGIGGATIVTYDGSSWVSLPAFARSPTSQSGKVRIAADGSRLYAVWWENEGGVENIYCSYYDTNNLTWVNVSNGAINPSAGFPQDPSVAIFQGQPIVSFSDSATYVYRFDGINWNALGAAIPIATSGTNLFLRPSKIQTSATDVFVYVEEQTYSTQPAHAIYVYQYNVSGDNWNMLGGSMVSPNIHDIFGGLGDFVLLNNEPYVSYSEGPASGVQTLRLQKWNGAAWLDVGPHILNQNSSYSAVFSRLSAVSNSIVLSWVEGSGTAGGTYERSFP